MNNKVILLVEDNPHDQDLTLLALKKHNIANEVEIANNGEEALELLFGHGPTSFEARNITPMVVLLDLKLPKVDGHEVLRQIRNTEATKTLPVVILTSSDEENDLIESYSLGCNSYVSKPVEFDTFVEATRLMGLYWFLVNEPPLTPH